MAAQDQRQHRVHTQLVVQLLHFLTPLVFQNQVMTLEGGLRLLPEVHSLVRKLVLRLKLYMQCGALNRLQLPMQREVPLPAHLQLFQQQLVEITEQQLL